MRTRPIQERVPSWWVQLLVVRRAASIGASGYDYGEGDHTSNSRAEKSMDDMVYLGAYLLCGLLQCISSLTIAEAAGMGARAYYIN